MSENMLATIRGFAEHARWADERLREALRSAAPPEALREQAHVLGAAEVWLSRLEGRKPRCGVWPDVDFPGLERLTAETHAALARHIERLGPSDLEAPVTYVNSAGERFTNTIGDILLHVFLHAQYHRGKVNLLLRQDGAGPAAADYIAFVRGAPAATQGDSRVTEPDSRMTAGDTDPRVLRT